MRRTVRAIGLVAAITTALLAMPARADDAPACKASVGSRAPGLAVSTSDGRIGVSLKEALRAGRPVVVMFWEWHCEPCKKVMPVLQKLSERPEVSASFLLVHLGPDEKKMREKLDELGIRLPSASDDTYSKRARFCVQATPRTLVVDKQGLITAIIEGAEPDFELRLRAALSEAELVASGE